MITWLLFLIAYLPFQIALNLPRGFDLASGRIFILLFFAVWFLVRLKKQGLKPAFWKQLFLNRTSILLGLFLLTALISIFGAENHIWGLRKFLFFISIFPLYFLTADLADGLSLAGVRKIIWVLAGSAGLIGLIGLIQFLAQFVFGLERVYNFWAANITLIFSGFNYGAMILTYPSWLVNINGATVLRAFSLFSDPHIFSMYLGMILPLIVSLVLGVRQCAFWGADGASGHGVRPESDERAEPASKFSTLGKIYVPRKHLPSSHLVLYILFFLLFIGLLLSFSRGAYLAIFATFLVLAWLVWRYLGAKKTALILVLSLLIFIIPGTPFHQRFFASFDPNEGSNLGRLAMWQTASQLSWRHFWFGTGLGNYSLAIDPNTDYRNPITSHNLYLDIFSEMGVFGLLIWLVLIFGALGQLFKKIKRAERQEQIVLIGLLGSLFYFSIHSFFETGLYNPTILAVLMIVLGLGASVNKNIKK